MDHFKIGDVVEAVTPEHYALGKIIAIYNQKLYEIENCGYLFFNNEIYKV